MAAVTPSSSTGFSEPGGGFEHLGRLAQDALYYHEGPLAPIPQDAERYAHRMSVPAGIRKTGPWVVWLSGIVATQNVSSRYYLDRQSNLEVFHQKYGLIISGANSKRQPELATFRERIGGQTYHMPLDTRLRMGEQGDRLSLAYNTFVADRRKWTRLPNPAAVPFHGEAERPSRRSLHHAATLPEARRSAGDRGWPQTHARRGAHRTRGQGPGRIDPPPRLDARLGWRRPARLARLSVQPRTPKARRSPCEYAVGALTFPLEGIGFTLEAR